MPRTSVVLPVPGPPVTTRRRLRTASAIASRWVGANATPSAASLSARAASAGGTGQDGGPRSKARTRSAISRSARSNSARMTSGPDSVRCRATRPAAHSRSTAAVTCSGAAAKSRAELGLGLLARQHGVAAVGGLAQDLGQRGADPLHGIGSDAQAQRDLIGGGEADAADVAGECVGVLADGLDRLDPVGLDDAVGTRGAETVLGQEQERITCTPLPLPRLLQASREARADPLDVAQAQGLALDHLAEPHAELGDEALGQLLADALDAPRGQIGDEPGLGGRGLERGSGSAELAAPARVVVPGALGADQLPGAGLRQGADHHHRPAATRGCHQKDAVAGLGPLEQDALDHADERVRPRPSGPARSLGRIDLHGAAALLPEGARRGKSASAVSAEVAMGQDGWQAWRRGGRAACRGCSR